MRISQIFVRGRALDSSPASSPLSQPPLSQPPLSQPPLSQPPLSQPPLSQPQLSAREDGMWGENPLAVIDPPRLLADDTATPNLLRDLLVSPPPLKPLPSDVAARVKHAVMAAPLVGPALDHGAASPNGAASQHGLANLARTPRRILDGLTAKQASGFKLGAVAVGAAVFGAVAASGLSSGGVGSLWSGDSVAIDVPAQTPFVPLSRDAAGHTAGGTTPHAINLVDGAGLTFEGTAGISGQVAGQKLTALTTGEAGLAGDAKSDGQRSSDSDNGNSSALAGSDGTQPTETAQLEGRSAKQADANASPARYSRTSGRGKAATEPRVRLAAKHKARVNSLNEETRLLEEARSKLGREPSKALSLALEHSRRFAKGQLLEQRRMIHLEALLRLGKDAEAQNLVRQIRSSLYSKRASALLARYGLLTD